MENQHPGAVHPLDHPSRWEQPFYRIGSRMEPSLIKEIFIIMNRTFSVLVGFSFRENE